MALQSRHKKFMLRNNEEFYNSQNEKVTTGERVIIEGTLKIDYGCFQKTKAEHDLLKSLRLDSKRDAMKRR